jgi:hypothetical protein
VIDMSYIEGEGKLLAANPKTEDTIILQIEIMDDFENPMDYANLRRMIKKTIRFSIENTIVSYKVPVNAKTNQPMTEYKVDETGLVSEVERSEGEQLEAELGLPKENVPVKEERIEAERTMIDEFIRSGLAPIFEDMAYDFPHILSRFSDGVTYAKVAYELNISLGEFSVILDEYRKRVAPLAAKWDEWRNGQTKAVDDVVSGNADEADTEEPGQTSDTTENASLNEGNGNDSSNENESDSDAVATEPSKEALEEYIFSNKPRFEDIALFPDILLEKKDRGLSWIEMAQEKKVASSELQRQYVIYKKKVKEHMKNNGAA